MSDGCDKVVYSFSRLSSFDNCPYSYNLTYNEEDRGEDSVYTFLGSAVHEIVEQLQKQTIDNQQAIIMFMDKVEDCEILDLEFMSESTKQKYIENISHFLANFKPITKGEFFIEEEIFVQIGDYLLRGFIDIYFKDKNEIIIIDYKTSSKFKKKELIPNGRQLVLYAMALEQKYPDCKVKAIAWDMLKYVEVEGARGPKLIERRELEGQEYKEGLVYHTLNDEIKQECIDYIIDTIQKIESATEYPPLDISKEYFYCSNLCGHRYRCEHYNKRFNSSYK